MDTLYGFGPIETVDTEKVDTLIRLATEWGEDFDIEFEGSDYNLKSYLANKVAIKQMQREYAEAEKRARKGFSDDVILNSIIYSAINSC
ncbi:MAG: hypothetical protein LBC63_09545 [Holophagales bacterium]|nr:hypothetical protein [Holophagales bacterium]